MYRLVIRHEPAGEGFRFQVQRVRPDGVKAAPTVEMPDPLSQVIGQTDLRLGDELTWYLENYLDYPYGPNQQRAERVMQALRTWGEQAFEALFDQGQASRWYHAATQDSHTELHLVIASDDAHVLAWPWEALHDPLVGDLAHHSRIERQLDYLSDPPELHPGLSRERIGILLVTARPYADDVAYRSISRPLVELIHEEGLPAEVKLLRPPTFEQLRRELQDKPGAYHIVHFDGHGGFGLASGASSDKFKGPQGRLMFEQADGSEDPVTGAQLSQLLREHRIPIAVLNACQSAMLGAEAEDAFASVATSLLKAGVRSVVAMGYSLYVSAAREFLPAFYRRLFESGSVAEAIRAGRQALLAQPERRPGFELQDWLVPVLYQQQPLHLDFARQAHIETQAADAAIPDEARLDTGETPHDLIGRDSAVLALERASRRPPASLLVHGLGGVGKTTLARGYIEWLARTQGLPQKVVWMSFVGIRTADYVLNRLVEVVFGTDAMAKPDEQKWPALVQALRSKAMLVIWDNFESASGAADVGMENESDGAMPEADRQRLKQFLEQLRGGKTKVLITSRSGEAWLGKTACYRIPLGGLQGEERQALAQAILADQSIRLDPKDQATADLIDSLEGHPLMMQVILPRLEQQSAACLKQVIEQYVLDAHSDDPVERRLYATLRYVEDGLPAELKPLLYPIALHEGHVDAGFLADMANKAQQPFTVQQTQQALELLEMAGLVQGIGKSVFRLHPALSRYLRGRAERMVDENTAQNWQRGFIVVMAYQAIQIARQPLHEQRAFFAIFEGSIEQARRLAKSYDNFDYYGALTEFISLYAYNRRDLPLAQRCYEAFARHCEDYGKELAAASAYHQLGLVLQQQRDFNAAEDWYKKALATKDQLYNKPNLASTYHQLGILDQERGNFDAAEVWYRKALVIKERRRDERGAAYTYHQLGTLAQQRCNFDAAEDWYNKALVIRERLGLKDDVADTYHQRGKAAQEQHDLDAAEDWYNKALVIREQQDDEPRAASTYHQLGIVFQERGDFNAAENWYHKALVIMERTGAWHSASITYYQLGRIAQERRDFETAKNWYRKSLEINAPMGDEHSAQVSKQRLNEVAEAQLRENE